MKARLLLFPADKGCSKQDWHNPTGWGEQTNDASTSPPPHNPPFPTCTLVKCSSWGRVNRHDTFFPNPSPPLPQQMHTLCVHPREDWMDMILSTLPLSLLLPTNAHTLVKTDTAICRTAIRPCGDIKSQSGGMNSLWASPSPWPSTSMSWMGRWLVGEVTCIRKQQHSQTYITNAQRHKPAMTV